MGCVSPSHLQTRILHPYWADWAVKPQHKQTILNTEPGFVAKHNKAPLRTCPTSVKRCPSTTSSFVLPSPSLSYHWTPSIQASRMQPAAYCLGRDINVSTSLNSSRKRLTFKVRWPDAQVEVYWSSLRIVARGQTPRTRSIWDSSSLYIYWFQRRSMILWSRFKACWFDKPAWIIPMALKRSWEGILHLNTTMIETISTYSGYNKLLFERLLFACWLILHAFCHLLIFFFELAFPKKYFRNQTVWIQIRSDVLAGLIWVQTVCKGSQQTTKVTTSGERVIPTNINCTRTLYWRVKKCFRNICEHKFCKFRTVLSCQKNLFLSSFTRFYC